MTQLNLIERVLRHRYIMENHDLSDVSQSLSFEAYIRVQEEYKAQHGEYYFPDVDACMPRTDDMGDQR